MQAYNVVILADRVGEYYLVDRCDCKCNGEYGNTCEWQIMEEVYLLANAEGWRRSMDGLA